MHFFASDPVLEEASNILFGPFNFAFNNQIYHFEKANLKPGNYFCYFSYHPFRFQFSIN